MSRVYDSTLPAAVHNEGLLFVPAVLEKLNRGELDKVHPLLLPEGVEFNAARNYAFDVALRLYRKFQGSLEQRHYRAITRQFVRNLMNTVLGWNLTPDQNQENESPFLTSPVVMAEDAEDDAEPCAFPVAVAPHTLSLDASDSHFHGWGLSASGRSPSRFIQEFLNSQKSFTWGMVSNGHELRLVRDNLSLTRPCYLSFNLDHMLSGEGDFTSFALFWRLLYATNANVSGNAAGSWDSDHSLWEAMRTQSTEDGIRALDGLRSGVVTAVESLGTGFLKANPSLREALDRGEMTTEEFETELLHLTYRFLFLFVAEERELLFAPDTPDEVRTLYRQGYSMSRLRRLAVRYAAGSSDRHHDLYEGVNLVFRALSQGQPRLGLTALGGIFEDEACAHLRDARLRNSDLLAIMRALRFTEAGHRLLPVNYRDMGPEELGSVYEGLLEYVPRYSSLAQEFSLIGAAGNNRKTTGSYYTPDSLVHELIESALEPLIQERLRKADPEQELLSLSVIDPACGSGHFLLAAARKIAGALIMARNVETSADAYQSALRDVVSHCIYGVDLNPLAVELTKITLWIESMEPGKPLSFLDSHIVCGDGVLGVDSPDVLKKGIPEKAYVCVTGDTKAIANELKKRNNRFLRDMTESGMPFLPTAGEASSEAFSQLELMPENTLQEVQAKRKAYQDFCAGMEASNAASAADLYMGAFLLPKTPDTVHLIPTTEELFSLVSKAGTLIAPTPAMFAATSAICRQSNVLHWHLTFPSIFAHGGFDCILANPPWDKVTLQEKEFFASRDPDIAGAIHSTERKKLIARLSLPLEEGGNPALLEAFKTAKRRADVVSMFLHSGGRFVLSNVGDINIYSVFAEVFMRLRHPKGKAGVIIPTGICTDNSNQNLFSEMVKSQSLQSLYDFENAASGKRIFEAVHPQYRFCLLTLGKSPKVSCAFCLGKAEEIWDERRRFKLEAKDFSLFNPNTNTAPLPRSKYDIKLLERIYRRVPVLWDENTIQSIGNPWHIKFKRLIDMANDSNLFHSEQVPDSVPLYEGKLINQFDHRWASFTATEKTKEHDLTSEEKQSPSSEIYPRYWVDREIVEARLELLDYSEKYLMGWRDVTNATNSHTVLASVIPAWAVGHTLPLYTTGKDAKLNACLLADFNSLVHDWVAQNKVSGLHITFFIKKQLATLPPSAYSQKDIDYIVPRVLKLTYTSHSLTPWAEALGYYGEPFKFDPEERSQLRAELDAWYARLYGLNREELTYILDPALVFGDDYPSESFRVLKKKEIKEYGEYRTARLVLEAFDKLEGTP